MGVGREGGEETASATTRWQCGAEGAGSAALGWTGQPSGLNNQVEAPSLGKHY